jgi:SAM-dependent methyltransferase
MLHAAGHQAIGIDPEAPSGPGFHQTEFERYKVPEPVHAMVACTSLHHVADLGETLDLIEAALVPDGRVVIVEWARERFDEATARWCLDRLPNSPGDPGWLQQIFADWRESGQTWDVFLRTWADAEGLHAGHDILRELSSRFDSEPVSVGPYFFSELAGTSEADEQAAIGAGQIQPNRIQYVGRRRQGRSI